MLNRIIEFLSGLKMTVVSGVCIAFSLVLALTGANVPVDPAWAAVIISGLPIAYAAVTGLFVDRRIYTALLITIAMAASVFIGELFAAGEIAFIMAIGGILEAKTVERARKGLKSLISLAPATGRRLTGGREEMIPAERIGQGDVLRVLPGEAIPVDGEIIAGDTSVDQSIMTGESLPVDKGAGDSVYCGTINRFGSVDIRATKVGEDSSLQKLIRMVRDAESNQAPTQRIVDKWAGWLVPIALCIAVVVFFAMQDIVRAVTVLVVFCPCALALATPVSIVAAIGQATKHGVVIKSGDALERMGKVDAVAFDKTGTLTYGRLSVSDVVSFDPSAVSDGDLLSKAASVEVRSEHPLGKAIASSAEAQGIDLRPSEDFKMIPGKGVSAALDGLTVMCGNEAWLSESGVVFDGEAIAAMDRLRQQGKAVVTVSEGGQALGVIALADTLRESARGMIDELEDTGTRSVLLTGDHWQTADYIAEKLEIAYVFAELLPEQKVERIQRLRNRGYNICMIGDGVNDAPALKAANVGVAMGGMGSDIAVEAADIALMGDDISKIPYLKRLSNATIKLIKLNIALAMCINFTAIILSILGVLTPVTGALWHNAASILVVLNAARLYDRRFI